MNYAVISDIHGNFHAFERILDVISKRKPDSIINCGDIVGYGPNPNECIESIRLDDRISSVIGNHDKAAIKQIDMIHFNPVAREAIEWTRLHLKPENAAFLGILTETGMEENTLRFVHGSPRLPVDEYIFGTYEADVNFKHFEEGICFVGHTHVPVIFECDALGKVQLISFEEGTEYMLDTACKRYIVNAGSVGQPRDSDPRAAVCFYDSESGVLMLQRIEYDVARTQRFIIDAGLPHYLSARLPEGR